MATNNDEIAKLFAAKEKLHDEAMNQIQIDYMKEQRKIQTQIDKIEASDGYKAQMYRMSLGACITMIGDMAVMSP